MSLEKTISQIRFEISQIDKLFTEYILDDEGKMIGSVITCDFPSQKELDEWLKKEPYVIGKVWEKIEIKRAQVAPFCLKQI